MTGVAIIGCGLIGSKRAAALKGARLVTCADAVPERAQALASRFGAVAERTWLDVLQRDDVDVVVVATVNSALAEIAAAALRAEKHVLVEKPAARFVEELDRVIEARDASGRCARVGFNHRYHPALQKAQELFRSGVLGEAMFVRARYGHGGRVGYESEWRANPEVSGGGELIDQGVHLIDLARLFLGDFTIVEGEARTLYWPMPVDDNAFLHLRTPGGQTAFLHASCTEWKNLFCLEFYGRDGKVQIDGLGGSYGVERITWYRMLPEMGPPETMAWEYPGADRSWELEMSEFLEDIHLRRPSSASLEDARAALVIVETIYRRSGYDFR